MKTYIVGYDLNKSGQDYSNLIAEIKTYKHWWHHLDSTWIIKTDDSAADIRNNLRRHIDKNDELLVAALTGESAWLGFSDKGGQWLKDNIQPN
jgi:hypothetical protein